MDRALGVARERLGGVPLTFTELDESGRPHVRKADAEQWGDAVILRKDVPASYHLAVVVDDARQGVTHVTRGRDLFRRPVSTACCRCCWGCPSRSISIIG